LQRRLPLRLQWRKEKMGPLLPLHASAMVSLLDKVELSAKFASWWYAFLSSLISHLVSLKLAPKLKLVSHWSLLLQVWGVQLIK
jgi:hypothetical protein